MIGEYKLEKTEDDMEDVMFPLTELQQKIAERYTVHPVDSCRAYQVLVSDDGLHHRILHRTFIFRMDGKATPSKVRTICDAMFASVCDLFPEDALVGGGAVARIDDSALTGSRPSSKEKQNGSNNKLRSPYFIVRLGEPETR